MRQAVLFLLLQLAVGAAVLFSLNRTSVLLGFAVLGLIGTYPFMKRITYWPQVFLGLNFNWGALIGWTAVTGALAWPPLLLYLGGVFWTIGYDTIYAHQDKEDDVRIGVKSSAIALGVAHPALALRFLRRRAALWAAAGHAAGLGAMFWVGLGRCGLQLAWQAARVAIDDPADCLAQVPLEPRRRLADARRDRRRPLRLTRLGPRVFIRRNTAITTPPLVPEIRLHLATEITPIWQATEESLARSEVPPPFWAFAWAGGQALARYLLDHPAEVAGRSVLDFGAGSGLVAIAAAKAGASSVLAAEIDHFAAAAIAANAALNEVAITVTTADLIDAADPRWEVITAGDVCYEQPMADRVTAWLRGAGGARQPRPARRSRTRLSAGAMASRARPLRRADQPRARGSRHPRRVVWQVLPLRSALNVLAKPLAPPPYSPACPMPACAISWTGSRRPGGSCGSPRRSRPISR